MTRVKSVRTKLIAVAMLTTCMSLLVLSVAIGSFEYLSHRRAIAERMATIGSIVGANSTAALTFNDEATATEILQTFSAIPDVRSACLYDGQGQLFAHYLVPGQRCPALSTGDGSRVEGGELVQTNPVLMDVTRIGTLRVAVTQDELWRRLRQFGLALASSLLLAAFTGLLLSSRLAGIVSRPLLELAATARRIATQQDYTLRAPNRHEDELGVAIDAFNQMLDRIEHTDQALREANQQSAEQASFLRSILDNMGEGLIVVDRQGEVLVWNAAATRIVGARPQGVSLQDWPSHFGLRSDPGAGIIEPGLQPLVRALAGETEPELELYLVSTEDGSARWLTATARPLRDASGAIGGAISGLRSTTMQKLAELELKRSEERLRQAQKMDAIGQLAGGIAHDFNNLLTVICGYSDTALSLLQPEHPARKEVDEVLRAGERAAALTRKLLDFSRKQPTAPRLLDLNAIVRDSEKMLARLIGEDIEMTVSCDVDLGWVLADPGQLEQMLVNLAVNARDAMPNGGALRLETSCAVLEEPADHLRSERRAGRYARLTVTDTGVGMTEEVRARIFEPFFTTKPLGKGTGLGLSTVYGIIQQCNGYVDVASAPGRGTSFSVLLPCAEGADAKPVVTPSAAPRLLGGTETVLVVEDEEAVRNLVGDTLHKFGYRVLLASDGVEALDVQAAHGGAIHLLVSDVVMPRMTGPELAERLVQRLPALQILFMSGYTGNAKVAEAVLLHKPLFIQKPFSVEAILRRVREALDRAPRGALGHEVQRGLGTPGALTP